MRMHLRAEPESSGEAEPRVPREIRPYLRDMADVDAADERLSTCPICGMPDPLNLPDRFLGWPAHEECKEWLGDWKPAVPLEMVPRKVVPRPKAAEPHVPTPAEYLAELEEHLAEFRHKYPS